MVNFHKTANKGKVRILSSELPIQLWASKPVHNRNAKVKSWCGQSLQPEIRLEFQPLNSYQIWNFSVHELEAS